MAVILFFFFTPDGGGRLAAVRAGGRALSGCGAAVSIVVEGGGGGAEWGRVLGAVCWKERVGIHTNIENSFKLIAILSYRYSILFYLLFYLFPIRQISSPILFFLREFSFLVN